MKKATNISVLRHIEISFTVPKTAGSPMFPPFKKIGETTKLSVENANSPESSKKRRRFFVKKLVS